MAVILVVGVAVPPLGALLRPFVPETVVAILFLAFVRIDAASLRSRLRRPWIPLLATLWTMLILPIAIAGAAHVVGLPEYWPNLYVALVLQAVAMPLMSVPALAGLLRLDTTFVVVLLVGATVAMPFCAPMLVGAFAVPGVSLSPLALGPDLLLIVVLSGGGALATRAFVSFSTVENYKDAIDGLNVLLLFVFVAAIMQGVGAAAIQRPLLVIALMTLAFGLFGAMLLTSALVFYRAGRAPAFEIGLTAATRNAGVMLAATSGALPETVWLYFAMTQLPMYLAPAMLSPVVRRLGVGSVRR